MCVKQWEVTGESNGSWQCKVSFFGMLFHMGELCCRNVTAATVACTGIRQPLAGRMRKIFILALVLCLSIRLVLSNTNWKLGKVMLVIV